VVQYSSSYNPQPRTPTHPPNTNRDISIYLQGATVRSQQSVGQTCHAATLPLPHETPLTAGTTSRLTQPCTALAHRWPQHNTSLRHLGSARNKQMTRTMQSMRRKHLLSRDARGARGDAMSEGARAWTHDASRTIFGTNPWREVSEHNHEEDSEEKPVPATAKRGGGGVDTAVSKQSSSALSTQLASQVKSSE
jgi:hypothetical protein